MNQYVHVPLYFEKSVESFFTFIVDPVFPGIRAAIAEQDCFDDPDELPRAAHFMRRRHEALIEIKNCSADARNELGLVHLKTRALLQNGNNGNTL